MLTLKNNLPVIKISTLTENVLDYLLSDTNGKNVI